MNAFSFADTVSDTVTFQWVNGWERRFHVYYDQCYSVVPQRLEVLPINLGNYPSDFSVRLLRSRLNGIEIVVHKNTHERPRKEVIIRWTAYFGKTLKLSF